MKFCLQSRSCFECAEEGCFRQACRLQSRRVSVQECKSQNPLWLSPEQRPPHQLERLHPVDHPVYSLEFTSSWDNRPTSNLTAHKSMILQIQGHNLETWPAYHIPTLRRTRKPQGPRSNDMQIIGKLHRQELPFYSPTSDGKTTSQPNHPKDPIHSLSLTKARQLQLPFDNSTGRSLSSPEW